MRKWVEECFQWMIFATGLIEMYEYSERKNGHKRVSVEEIVKGFD